MMRRQQHVIVLIACQHGASARALAAVAWDLWRQRPPTLLISIAGLEPGSGGIGPKLERTLVDGLKQVITTTGAWLLTPGLRGWSGGSPGALADRVVESWEVRGGVPSNPDS